MADVQPGKVARQIVQRRVNQVADRTERMIRRNALLQPYVTEYGLPTADLPLFGSVGIGSAHFGARLICREHPFDAGACGIPLTCPGDPIDMRARSHASKMPLTFDTDHQHPERTIGDMQAHCLDRTQS